MKAFTETTLPNLFLNRAYRYGTKPFLYYKANNEWKHYTWHEISEYVEKIGRGLLAMGIKKDDKICLISENRPEWVMFDLAILSIGAVTVPVYSTSTPEQIGQIIEHSESVMTIVSKLDQLEQIKSKGSFGKVKHWICFEKNESKAKYPSLVSIVEHSKHVDGFTFYQTLSKVEPSQLATIVYTSGTTGDPKGVMLSHENMVSNTIASAKMISISESDISLSFLPLSHLFERTGGFFCFVYFGATIYYAEDMQKIPENLLEVRPTILITVPRVLEKFYNRVFENIENQGSFTQKLFRHALKTKNSFFLNLYSKIFFSKIRDRMGGRIKFIVSGGAALTTGIARFYEQIGIPVLQGYGLTETSPVIAVNRLKDNRIGTVGHVLDNLEVKLSDDHEILVKGPSIMLGYFKNEQATRDVFTADGFFKTGDIGEYSEGFLKITDRKKELIVTSGGKKIAPQPIENELLHHPIIDQVCLVGEGMKTIGALVVPNRTYVSKVAGKMQIDDSDYKKLLERQEILGEFQKIINGVNVNLPSYEQIKIFKLIAEPFSQENNELTPTLKLRRKNIFEHYQPEIDAMFSTHN